MTPELLERIKDGARRIGYTFRRTETAEGTVEEMVRPDGTVAVKAVLKKEQTDGA